MIAAIHGILEQGGYDPDALAFINAAVLTEITHKDAINDLVISLKGAGIWTKFAAIYPVIGGTAEQHKFNLKNVKNNTQIEGNAAFRLTYHAPTPDQLPTHDANGITFNGINNYANTYVQMLTHLTRSSTHFSYYNRVAMTEASIDGRATMGAGENANAELALAINRANNIIYAVGNVAAVRSYTSPQTGLFMGNRTALNNTAIWLNGAKVAETTTTDTGAGSSLNITLGKGSNFAYSAIPCSFASIGGGLTDAEATAFYNIVQKYQTKLGRQV
jgi:hypothetical protein